MSEATRLLAQDSSDLLHVSVKAFKPLQNREKKNSMHRQKGTKAKLL